MIKDIDIFYLCEIIMALRRCTMGQGVAFPWFFFLKEGSPAFEPRTIGVEKLYATSVFCE